MSYSSQLHYLHGIAKTRVPVGPRISSRCAYVRSERPRRARRYG